MARAKNYSGFGEVHGLREWARLLDVNKDTLGYHLGKGKTVEEFAAERGIEYTARLDEGRTRVNRMAQAEALLADLFDRSDYDPELVATTLLPGTRILRVVYSGTTVGMYHLDSGALRLSVPDEGINLLDYPVQNPKIYRYPEGWGAHPDTRRAMVNYCLSQNAPQAYPEN